MPEARRQTLSTASPPRASTHSIDLARKLLEAFNQSPPATLSTLPFPICGGAKTKLQPLHEGSVIIPWRREYPFGGLPYRAHFHIGRVQLAFCLQLRGVSQTNILRVPAESPLSLQFTCSPFFDPPSADQTRNPNHEWANNDWLAAQGAFRSVDPFGGSLQVKVAKGCCTASPATLRPLSLSHSLYLRQRAGLCLSTNTTALRCSPSGERSSSPPSFSPAFSSSETHIPHNQQLR